MRFARSSAARHCEQGQARAVTQDADHLEVSGVGMRSPTMLTPQQKLNRQCVGVLTLTCKYFCLDLSAYLSSGVLVDSIGLSTRPSACIGRSSLSLDNQVVGYAADTLVKSPYILLS